MKYFTSIDLAFGWDPTEPVATRPLWIQRPTGNHNFFCFHDGNKNVSDVVSYQSAYGVAAHYEYAPFGAVTVAINCDPPASTAFNAASTNPFRFSSEYADDTLGLVYYNYRHYNSTNGRWTIRDSLAERSLFVFSSNNPVSMYDFLGLLDELSFEEYLGQFIDKEFKDGLTERELAYIKTSLYHGCIGVTWINLGHSPHPSQNDCYSTRAGAENRKKSLSNECCKNGGEAVIYSLQINNSVGRDAINPKARFNSDGSVDMRNLDNRSGEFDYGFVLNDGRIIGATAYYNPKNDIIFPNHPIKEDSKVVIRDMEEWQRGARPPDGYDTEVWCVECRNLKDLKENP